MRTALLYGPHDVRISETDVPEPGPSEVLVKVAFCGVCGTDLHSWLGRRAGAASHGPKNLGHEISGTVASLGPGVTRVSVGDEVAVNPYIFCGACFYCQNDFTTHCLHRRIYTRGWAEYVLAHENGTYLLPQGVSLELATQAESLAACLHAVDLGQIRPGWTAVVQGAGPMGLMVHALARLSGAVRTIVSEPSEFRRELALEMGADVVIDPAVDDIVDVARRETGGHGADIAFDCVTRSFTLKSSINAVHAGGTVVIVGNLPDDDQQFPVPTTELKRREITIRGSFSRDQTFERSLRWLRRIDFGGIISDVTPMSELNTVFQRLEAGTASKILVTP